jgi:hypothetical protein
VFVDKAFLEKCLADGMSLPQIGKLAGRDPSTVGYWVQKHGFVANGRQKYSPKGGIVEEVLEIMVDDGLTLQEMADQLELSVRMVRYWLDKHGLEPVGRKGDREEWHKAREAGVKLLTRECRHHGSTMFVLDSRGFYKCKKCRSVAVAERRRVVKRTLVEDAGGRCVICGYDRCEGALQFHHLDPATKAFSLSHAGTSRSLAKSREEASKCVLLCANCHAEVEAGVTPLPVESESLPFRGSTNGVSVTS